VLAHTAGSRFVVPLCTLLLAAAGVRSARDTYPRNPGIDIEHYAFTITLSDTTDVIGGVATVRARFVAAGQRTLRLDLVGVADSLQGAGMTVDAVRLVAGPSFAAEHQTRGEGSGETPRPLRWTHERDQLLIDLGGEVPRGEPIEAEITYHGRPASGLRIGPDKYGDRTFFSDNWPHRARNWLPTVDHPYDKATSEMRVIAPAHYQVVSNGLLVEETDLGGGVRRTHWKQSVPIATWLYALGAAEFAVQHRGTFAGVPVETWVYRQDRDAGFSDFASPTPDVLTWFSDRIGPYAYEKLANVVANSVSGGMEAASSIFYGDRSVTGTGDRGWKDVVTHEIAHQWFGNAVTEADWDDVWLSEGFATYFTLLYREHAYGRDDFVAGLRQSRDRVLAFYETRPDYRVVHDNLADMSQVTTRMTYEKGAWTLHMLRERIGTDTFWRGIRAYYAQYRNRNATTADFRRAMEDASHEDLEPFFRQWLYQGGIPDIALSWRWDARSKEIVVSAKQTQSAYSFAVDVEVEPVSADGQRARGILALRPGAPDSIRIPMDAKPTSLVVDPDTRLLARWTVRS
jgi:aminopeptidase N